MSPSITPMRSERPSSSRVLRRSTVFPAPGDDMRLTAHTPDSAEAPSVVVRHPVVLREQVLQDRDPGLTRFRVPRVITGSGEVPTVLVMVVHVEGVLVDVPRAVAMNVKPSHA